MRKLLDGRRSGVRGTSARLRCHVSERCVREMDMDVKLCVDRGTQRSREVSAMDLATSDDNSYVERAPMSEA